MPELPEVESLTRAIRDTLLGHSIKNLKFFRSDLRDPIPVAALNEVLVGQPIVDVFRRSKYLLLRTESGLAIVHLGMTGNLLRRSGAAPELAHTHAVITYEDQKGVPGYLHYVDPRRFGRLACMKGHDMTEHEFFRDLGPEPLALTSKELGAHLFEHSRGRKAPIKNFIMDARIVVGVGNIYASESLFRAGLSPKRHAGAVARQRYELLAQSIQETLTEAIAAGGTSFRDFKNSSGEPGYFSINLSVYGREGAPCIKCQKEILQIRQGGRSTYYCSHCQK